jgi:HEAT repeat protein
MDRRRIFAAAALAAVLLAVPAPPAGAGAAATVRWAPSLATALAEAKEKGCPVLVALNMDGERGNESMVQEAYRDPHFLAVASKCVCTVGSMGTHPEVKDAARGRLVCARFGSLTCAEHQAVEKIIREDWLRTRAGEDVNSPQHFFLAPDGRRMFQRLWTIDAKELTALLSRAVELCAPESLAEWDTVEGRLRRAADPLPPVREGALQALAAMKDPAVDARLADVARKAGEEGVRCDVLAAFARGMTAERLPVALDLMGSKSADVRMNAGCALEASKAPEALAALVAALGREKDAKVKGVLYRCVSRCAPKDPAAKAAVLAGLKERNAEVLPHAIVALEPWAADEDVVLPLKEVAFSKQAWPVRAAACWVLGLSGRRELAPEFLKIGNDGDRRSRLAATARMASQRLSEGYDALLYRRALRGFAPTPITHPGDVDE